MYYDFDGWRRNDRIDWQTKAEHYVRRPAHEKAELIRVRLQTSDPGAILNHMRYRRFSRLKSIAVSVFEKLISMNE